MSYISELLQDYTCDHSSFEETRDYISMSYASLPKEEILRLFKETQKPDDLSLLRCYKGYQMEKDLKDRIFQVFHERVIDKPEIVAHEGLVKGHPDFRFDGFPADCKTVPLDDHLPIEKKVSRKIYCQMQAYMLYDNKEKALVIYESRETGRIFDLWLRENKVIQAEIEEKYRWVVNQLK